MISLTTCFSPLDYEGPGIGETIISINLGSINRASWPPDPAMISDMDYEITLTQGSTQSGPHHAKGGTVLTVRVQSSGLWNVLVKAFYNGDLYATGTDSIDVRPGQVNTLPITMAPNIPPGTPYLSIPVINFSLEFNYPSTPHTITITNIGDADATVTDIILSGTDSSSFTLAGFSTPFNIIATGGTDTFTITPNTGLSVRTYNANVTVTYNSGLTAQRDIIFNVTRAAGAAVDVPQLNIADWDSIIINPVLAPATGQTVEYAISTSTAANPNSLSWQTSLIFTGLLPATDYYIYARSAANVDYTAGSVSVSNAIRTLNTFNVPNTSEWNRVITAIRNSGNNKTYIINVTGDFDVAAYTANTFASLTDLNVTINGIGSPILILSGNGNILRVGTNQTITINDLTLNGHSSNTDALIRSSGNLTMEGNATVTGNTNISTTNIRGGGVYITAGTFNMNNDSIVSFNVNTGGTTKNGGGVYIDSGVFTMNDNASVFNNTTVSSGGGVYVNTGNFIMNGGDISYNNSQYGAGVDVNIGSFTMNSGFISNNTATSSGGGVYTMSTFTMNGGTISGNNGGSNGGGIFVYGNFHMLSGIVYGNEVIPDSLRNTVSGSLSRGAAISLSTIGSPTAQYSDGTDILPHDDGYPTYTDITINGR